MQRFFFRERKIAGVFPEFDVKMQKKMRRVFAGDEGEEVLTFMLVDLGFFDGTERNDPQARKRELLTGEAAIRANALRDYARRLLEQLGILHEGNAYDLTKKLMELPVWEPKDTK